MCGGQKTALGACTVDPVDPRTVDPEGQTQVISLAGQAPLPDGPSGRPRKRNLLLQFGRLGAQDEEA